MAEDKYKIGKAGNASINLAKGARADFGSNEEILKKIRELERGNTPCLSDILEMNKNEIAILLGEINTLPAKKSQKLMDLAMECCYDRNWCKENKVNYDNISGKEYSAVLIYNYLKLEEKK